MKANLKQEYLPNLICNSCGQNKCNKSHQKRFQFMANKQFRMEKKIGNISVRWYLTICSQKLICSIFIWKNHSTHFFWWHFFLSFRFLDQTQLSKKKFFGLTLTKKNFFFNLIFKFLTIRRKKKNWQHASFVFKKKGCKRIFHWCDKKNSKAFWQKKF